MFSHLSLAPASPRIGVIIPAHNEAQSIALVLAEIPAGLVQEVVVVDNNSSNDTGARARAAGATVLHELRPGYGYGHACLAGMAHFFAQLTGQQPTIIVLLDGDHSDYPEETPAVLAPSCATRPTWSSARAPWASVSAAPCSRSNASATGWPPACYACGTHTDLGPFRAIRREALPQLGMMDKTYGWTVEMQVKAARQGLRTVEAPCATAAASA